MTFVDRLFMIEYIRIKNSEVHPMKYVYVEFADETLVTFNDIRRDNNGEHIDVYFERPTEDGFAFLQISLPDLNTVATEGLSEEEIEKLCADAIKSNESAVKDYLDGKEKALKAILGFVMKQTRGKGDPLKIEQKIIEKIKND